MEKKKPLSIRPRVVVERRELKEFQSVEVRQPKVDAPSAVAQVRALLELMRPDPVRSVNLSPLIVNPVVVKLVEVAEVEVALMVVRLKAVEEDCAMRPPWKVRRVEVALPGKG